MSQTRGPVAGGAGWVAEFVLLAALWGSSFMFMRLAAEFGPMVIAFLRTLIASLFLLPILVWQGKLPELQRHARRVLLVGMINSGIPFALFAWAVLSISTGLSAILNATAALFGALIAWAWLGDRPRPLQVLGLLLGFAGVAMLVVDQAHLKQGGSALSVLACLLAALSYGVAASYTKRYLGGIAPMATAAGSQIGAALGLALPALWLWPATNPSGSAWLAVLMAGVLCTGVAYILYFRLIARTGPAKAMTVTFMVPVFAILYGTLLLGEALTPWMLLCGLVVVCGTALATGLIGARRAA